MSESMDRLLLAAKQVGLNSAAEIARALNIGDQATTNWGARKVSASAATRLQAMYGISAAYVIEGKLPMLVEVATSQPAHASSNAIPLPARTPIAAGESVLHAVSATPPSGYIRLEHLSPQPSMGRGSELDDPVYIVQYLDVLEEWVRRKIGAADPARIKVLTGVGRSMRPTIEDEDLVFVDTGCRAIDHPDIYVLSVGKRLLIKRALILVGEQLLVLRSDNEEEFPDEERIPLKSSDTIIVAGRVKAWWTLRR